MLSLQFVCLLANFVFLCLMKYYIQLMHCVLWCSTWYQSKFNSSEFNLLVSLIDDCSITRLNFSLAWLNQSLAWIELLNFLVMSHLPELAFSCPSNRGCLVVSTLQSLHPHLLVDKLVSCTTMRLTRVLENQFTIIIILVFLWT